MGRLYVVGTPIGNLGDLSPRAAEILESVDFIAAEDTRVSIKLLNHLGLKKPLVSCHEHNIREASQSITARLLAGEDCAIVTDAGMPCISDPGEQLVDACHKLGIPVVALVDTNTDPESVDYPIPANDDAIRGIELLTSLMADAVADGLLERSGRAAKAEGETEAEQPMAAWEKELLTEGASAEAAPAAEAEEAKAE